jgi:hypothetical protein
MRFLSAGAAGGMICDVCCLKAFLIFGKARITAWLRLKNAAA